MIRSVDFEANLRLDVVDILSSLLNNLLIIFGDFSNVVIRSYVSTRFLILQYLIIVIFLITVFFASKKFNMEKLLSLCKELEKERAEENKIKEVINEKTRSSEFSVPL